ncbi:MAG: hypothetical protein KBS62_05280 [Oscillospiraceae bacterium]|nr:hypothetical protein [Candidatus Ruminococcus equi]
MGIKYFYNIIYTKIDDTDLLYDILSNIRKEYFDEKTKVKSKFTVNSESNPVFYEYSIEHNKPMFWSVSTETSVIETVKNMPDDKYSICANKNGYLFKKLNFSKYHTLLKVGYYSKNGELICEIEPRRASIGLCLLMKSASFSEPLLLFSMPKSGDDFVDKMVDEQFTDYFVEAYTDEGVVKFLSNEQLIIYNNFVDECYHNKEVLLSDESFISKDETELAAKINPAYFNVKRNLSEIVDITKAEPFEDEISPKINEKEETTMDENTIVNSNIEIKVEEEHNPLEEYKVLPDKVIEVDGTEYLYYGNLDFADNRDGYGRTMLNGKTTYEGYYSNDKRNGVGSYYYKDGGLCYFGDWKDNSRNGLGVGISSVDASIHVGTWKDNKPFSNGVRLAKDGNVKFVRKELSTGETVLINFMPDDSVIIAKYDINENKIGEKTYNISELI